MPCFHRTVAGKITIVECQNPLDSVDVHGGHKPSIVNLHSRDSAGDDQFSPLPMHRHAIGEKIQGILDHRGSRIRLFDPQSVAVPINRPGACVPELGEVLRGVAESAALTNQPFDQPIKKGIITVVRFDP